jgi:hypothetical protein
LARNRERYLPKFLFSYSSKWVVVARYATAVNVG